MDSNHHKTIQKLSMKKKVETRVFLDSELDGLVASRAAAMGISKPKYIAWVMADLTRSNQPSVESIHTDHPKTIQTIQSSMDSDLDSELSGIKDRLSRLELSINTQSLTSLTADTKPKLYADQLVDGKMGNLYDQLARDYDAKAYLRGSSFYVNNKLRVVYRTDAKLVSKSGKPKFEILEVFEGKEVIVVDGSFGVITEDMFDWHFVGETIPEAVITAEVKPDLQEEKQLPQLRDNRPGFILVTMKDGSQEYKPWIDPSALPDKNEDNEWVDRSASDDDELENDPQYQAFMLKMEQPATFRKSVSCSDQ